MGLENKKIKPKFNTGNQIIYDLLRLPFTDHFKGFWKLEEDEEAGKVWKNLFTSLMRVTRLTFSGSLSSLSRLCSRDILPNFLFNSDLPSSHLLFFNFLIFFFLYNYFYEFILLSIIYFILFSN